MIKWTKVYAGCYRARAYGANVIVTRRESDGWWWAEAVTSDEYLKANPGARAFHLSFAPTMAKVKKEILRKVGSDMIERENLMSGEKYSERRDTPIYCSPAYESYWSM